MRIERQAAQDASVLRRWRGWLYLGVVDVNRQYRRAAFGLIWLLAQPLAWLAIIWIVFEPVFAPQFPNYLSYVAVGIVTYNAAAQTLGSAPDTFVRHRAILLNLPISPFDLVLRSVTSSVYTLLVQSPIAIAVLVWQGALNPAGLGLAVAGFLLLFVFIVAVTVVFAVIGAFSGDFRFLVQVSMRFLFFATPIFWLIPAEPGLRQLLAGVNPLTHYISMIRRLVEGYQAPFDSLLFCSAWTAAAVLIAAVFWTTGRKALTRAL
ncbi:MAG: ABC transporter permease [Oceanicaulis sp.]